MYSNRMRTTCSLELYQSSPVDRMTDACENLAPNYIWGQQLQQYAHWHRFSHSRKVIKFVICDLKYVPTHGGSKVINMLLVVLINDTLGRKLQLWLPCKNEKIYGNVHTAVLE